MIKPTDSCTGCLACCQSCPTNCISAKTSEEGFLYPEIDIDRCINCGKCEKSCPLDKTSPSRQSPSAFAAASYDDSTRTVSSSGGVFSLIAEKIISKGGHVFGAAFDKDFSVIHKSVSDVENLADLRGSKYLQSNISNTFSEAKSLLDSGKPVLFSGTPCQIAGLRSFLGREYDNLICQDIICHSVPSPKVWKHYLSLLTRGEKPIAVHFRDKSEDWENYTLTVTTESGKTIRSPGKTDPYIRAFISGLESRKSCSSCRFRRGKSGSDITLADCWGVKRFSPESYDKNGVSLVFVNSEKGRKIFGSISDNCRIKAVDYIAATEANPAALYPSEAHRKRNRFLRESVNTETCDKFMKLYSACIKTGFCDKVLNFLSHAKRKIKRTIHSSRT